MKELKTEIGSYFSSMKNKNRKGKKWFKFLCIYML